MKMLCEQFSSYDDLDNEFVGVAVSQRERKKDTVPSSRTRSKKRSNRKRGGPTSIVGISHRRLRHWS